MGEMSPAREPLQAPHRCAHRFDKARLFVFRRSFYSTNFRSSHNPASTRNQEHAKDMVDGQYRLFHIGMANSTHVENTAKLEDFKQRVEDGRRREQKS